MTETTAEGWADILEPGEEVLWQGQPDPRPDLSALRPGAVAVGLAVTLFALVWTAIAASAAAGGGLPGLLMPLFGLVFVGLGLHRAGGHVLWDSYRRRRTWYSLTSRRAFIATDLFGRRDLEAYPITRTTVLDHDRRMPGSIYFATDYVKTRKGSRRRRIGFERLPDSDRVMDLMLRVQRQQA